ncbi:MAG: hypothetical protein HRU43_02295 [Simkaniaceae bacterium]|nr:hypothetical protein [Simkaniaceae bacterium]
MPITTTSAYSYSTHTLDMRPPIDRSLDRWNVPPSPSMEFAVDDAPYLVTTEDGQVEALHALSIFPPTSNGVLLGFANEFNYNILANRDVKGAVICDINARMHRVYKWTEENILKYEYPSDFLAAFRSEIEKHPDIYESYLATPAGVIEHYEQDFMWTSDLRSYQKIRAMYQAGFITHVNLNLIRDEAYFDSLALWASENGYVFDSIYVSNIPEWAVRGSGVNEMKKNLLKVLNPNTILIDAKQVRFESGKPHLRLSSGIVSMETFPDFKPVRRELHRRTVGPILENDPRAKLNFQ